MEQNYLMVNPENVVDNICVWNGDINTWQPPEGYTMLVQATTPAMVWRLNAEKNDYVLAKQIGVAGIEFIWDGTACTTNEPKPNAPVQPPTTEGTQTL